MILVATDMSTLNLILMGYYWFGCDSAPDTQSKDMNLCL
jgi:hypothetical protein